MCMRMNNIEKLSVVVPCYNEEEGISELMSRLEPVLQGMALRHEVILVDDGSEDRTWEMIGQFAQKGMARGIRLSRNYGHQLAISAGLEKSGGDAVFIIDADLQDPPELFPEMIKLIEQGNDVVYGQRIRRKGVIWWKKACYKNYYRILRFLAGCPIPADTGDFRVMRRHVVDAIVGMPEQQRFLRGMISWLGFRQAAYPYERDPRFAGEAKYTLSKLFKLAWDGIMSFSIQPLRLALVCGAGLSVLSLGVVVSIIINKLIFGQPPEGWSSLMAVILLIGGMQFLVLGIMGEYLGRVFLESKRRPLYLIQEECSCGPESGEATKISEEPKGN